MMKHITSSSAHLSVMITNTSSVLILLFSWLSSESLSKFTLLQMSCCQLLLLWILRSEEFWWWSWILLKLWRHCYILYMFTHHISWLLWYVRNIQLVSIKSRLNCWFFVLNINILFQLISLWNWHTLLLILWMHHGLLHSSKSFTTCSCIPH